MADDRRAAIEAAFEAEDKKLEEVVTPTPEVVEPIEAAKEAAEPEEKQLELELEEKPTEVAEKVEPEPEVKPVVTAERAPQSWKPAEKAKWAALDPGVRQEVMRREREITKTLSETAVARQLHQDFQQVIQPFMGRLQSMNAHPLVAVQELLKADYLLSTSPKVQKAQFLAKLIADYDVDVQALDDALSGRAPPDPVDAKVEALLQQRLAPFQQQLSHLKQQAQQREQQTTKELESTIAEFEAGEKYPYYDQVRQEMADIIELSAKRGVYVTLESAYNKAIQLDPIISQELAAQSATAKAAKANAQAQRALKASVSVGGAPSGVVAGSPTNGSRRAAIEAALEAVGGR